jgi:hypothetical protein
MCTGRIDTSNNNILVLLFICYFDIVACLQQMAAVNCSDVTTRSVAREIEKLGKLCVKKILCEVILRNVFNILVCVCTGGWDKMNGTVASVVVEGKGLNWYQSRVLRDQYGLHWHVVVVETVT